MMSCSKYSKEANNKEEIKDIPQLIVDSLENTLKEWRQDSLGISGHRDKHIEEIFTKYPFKKRTCSDIVKDFGKPNFIYKRDTICVYHYNLKCNQHKDGSIGCECSCSIQCDKNDSITYRNCGVY